jgi:DNA-binding beta-propeller fold protein YncE
MRRHVRGSTLLVLFGAVAAFFATLISTSAERGDAPEHLLVSLSSDKKVVLVDPGNGRLVHTFDTVSGPHEITVEDAGRRAYVANAGGGPGGTPGEHVTVIDLATRAVRQISIAPHTQPHDVRVSRDGRLLWVAVAPSRAILEIDTLTSRVVRTFDVQREGGWFVIASRDDRHLFVPLLEGKGLVLVDRVRGTSRLVLTGGAFSGAVVSPDGREVWAIEHEARRIHIVGTASGQIITRIPLERAEFGRLQFTPDGHRVFVVQGRRLLMIDAAGRRQVAGLEMPLDGKVIAISTDGTHAAISNPEGGKVTIVELSRFRVISTFDVGSMPDGLSWVHAR